MHLWNRSVLSFELKTCTEKVKSEVLVGYYSNRLNRSKAGSGSSVSETTNGHWQKADYK